MSDGFSFEEASQPQGFSFEEASKPAPGSKGFSFKDARTPVGLGGATTDAIQRILSLAKGATDKTEALGKNLAGDIREQAVAGLGNIEAGGKLASPGDGQAANIVDTIMGRMAQAGGVLQAGGSPIWGTLNNILGRPLETATSKLPEGTMAFNQLGVPTDYTMRLPKNLPGDFAQNLVGMELLPKVPKIGIPEGIIYEPAEGGATFKTAKARAAQKPGPTPEIVPDPAAAVPEAVPAAPEAAAPEAPVAEPVSQVPEINPVETPEPVPATPVAETIAPAAKPRAPRARKPAVLRDESITEPISFEEAWTPPEELSVAAPDRDVILPPDELKAYEHAKNTQMEFWARGKEGDPQAAQISKEMSDTLERRWGHLSEEQRATLDKPLEDEFMGRAPDGDLQAQQGSLRAQPKLTAIEAADVLNIEPLEKGLYDLAGDLNKTLGITHRQGGFKGKNTLGIYRPGTGVIRTREMHEVDVLSHEGGHHLEYLELPELSKTLAAHDALLRTMAYPGAAENALRQEGFAEFFRWYVTNPEVAMKEAPGFYKDFEAALAVDRPDILAKLKDVQAHHDALMKAPSAAVAMQDVVAGTPKGPFTKMMEGLQENPRRWTANFANDVYTGIVDRFNPINRAQKDLLEIAFKRTGRKVNREAYQDAYKIARSAPGARDAGHMDITDGVYGYRSAEPETLPLSEGVRLALQMPDDAMRGGNGGPPTLSVKLSQKQLDLRYHQFGAYLNARNMLAQWERYWDGGREKPPTSIPASVYAQAIKTFEAANPHWDRAANIVYDWNTALWRKRRDYGFITKEQYANGIDQHPDYVPAQRDMSDPGMDPDLIAMGKAGGDTGKYAGGVKQMRGSSRRVVDPIWTMAQQAYELNMLIARNESVGALADAVKIAGRGGAAIMEEVPTSKIKAIDVNLNEAIANAIKERGHSLSERDEVELEQAAEMISDIMGEDAKTKIYRAGDRTDDQTFLHHWKDGRRHTYELAGGQYGKQLYDAYANMNRPMQSQAINVMAWPARILRLGVVTNPRFAVRNVMGDQPAAAVFNKGYIPFYDWAKGIVEDVTGGDYARRHSAARGAIGGMQTAAERNVLQRKTLKVLGDRGFKVTDIGESFTRLSELGETGTRLGIFMKEAKAGEKRGLSPWEADQGASYAARDVLDFDRRGSYAFVQALTRIIPFLNANLQGVDKSLRVQFPAVLLRAMRGEKPVTATEKQQLSAAAWAWMGVGIMAAGSVALEAWNEEHHGAAWKEVPDWLKQNNWVFFDPRNPQHVFVWKKPYELGAYGNALARIYEAIATDDPTAYGKAMTEFAGMFVPAAVEPPILGIPFHLAANRDQFGQPIVAPGIEDVEPRDQYNDYTSGTAIKMGELMNMSPAQLDFVMHGLSGYNGKDILTGIDQATGRHADIEANATTFFFTDSFVRDATRGNNSSKQFFDLNDKLAHSEASIAKMVREGRDDEALARMKELTPEQKGWVLLNVFGHGKEKQAHPLVYAQKYYGVVSQLTKDVEAGDVRPTPTGERVPLTAHERREVVDALHQLNMAQLHEALRGMGEPGWENQEPISIDAALKELEEASPGVRQALTSREHGAELMPLKTSQQLWKTVRRRYEDMDDRAFQRAAQAKMKGGRGGATRLLRERAE